MNDIEKIKLGRILDIFLDNYRLTHLIGNYLSFFPELITKKAVDTLTEDGLDKKDALVALLTEIFGLDYSVPEDRRLIRDYLPKAVRLLDAEKYRNDPYYKNIRIPNKKIGNWELLTESYKPYRGVICDDMAIDGYKEYSPLGFFSEEFFFPAVLENGNEWMTLTPVDLDTSVEAIEKAHGKVITFGLGLGYYAYMVSRKPEVESITVIEKSPDVIKLFKDEILPQFDRGDKVRVINADAFEYAEKIMPEEGYDFAFVDTWRDASDGLPMYERMKKLEHLSGGTEFSYWIEGFILSRQRSLRVGQIIEKFEENRLTESYLDILKELSL